MLFREGYFQLIGLSSGLLGFAHMNVLAFSFRSHMSHGNTDRVVILNVQNILNECVCIFSQFQMLFGLPELWSNWFFYVSPCLSVYL